MDRRRRLLLNDGERATDLTLQVAAETNKARVFPKPRLASVLHIDDTGLSNEEYAYALKAELDFVLAEVETGLPLLAVEFDEPHHRTDAVTIRRDRMKNSICARLGLPLLRVSADFLRPARHYTLLAWLVEAWFREKWFYEAQVRGEISSDEPYCYFSFIDELTADGRTSKRWFSLDSEARSRMVGAVRAGLADSHVPETITTPFSSSDEVVESYCIFEMRDQRYIIGYAQLNNFQQFAGVPAYQLVTDLAVADCGEKLLSFRQGERAPAAAEQLAALRRTTQGWLRQGSSLPNLR